MKTVELLAPAKNLITGKHAINYGADAVYIGANRFGARAAAANSVADIEMLVQYAHKYGAKVYVTLNTILYDSELKEAEALIHSIYNAGADALIIQDMGILQMDIPPIPLHASTQTNNYSLDRIRFLDEIGFKRIVLARELSLNEIQNIRSQIKAELEFFIHGSLCVSLSGQCYFSQAITGRSANRGMCAQMCRHPYNLLDAKGNKLAINKHLLSLKDLNLSNDLKELIHAGITSLKIEGRLKDENYVKNIVSFYRKKLDAFFLNNTGYSKPSSGSTEIEFEPNPEKSFNRHSTSYFLKGREQGLVNEYSPKSMGEKLGTVESVGVDFITLNTNKAMRNGDGVCFISQDELIGVRVEKVINNKVFVNDTSKFATGIVLYRNFDHEFTKLLEADKSVRKIHASIVVKETENSLVFMLTDEDELVSVYTLSSLPDLAKNPDLSILNLRAQLSKSGSSIFRVDEVDVQCKTAYFFRMSDINEIRRILFEQHEQLRLLNFVRKDVVREKQEVKFYKQKADFSENISNQKAKHFYTDCGVDTFENAIEVSELNENQLLMTTRYCIKYELGFCNRFQDAKNTPVEPLYLEDRNRKYILEFDCKNCLMQIKMI
jgi:putative protease